MLRFNRFYFALFIAIFLIEVVIAVYVKDDFVRPYLGDTLVVILIYCFVRAFLKSPITPTIFSVLIFSYIVETMQYFSVVDMLGLGQYEFARIIIGTSFAWEDIVAYTVGAVIIWIVERHTSIKEQH